nr:hypothetical protein [uncultured Faecalimonas sp.]
MKRRIAVVCIGVMLASSVLVGNVDGKEPGSKGRGAAYSDVNGDGVCDECEKSYVDADGDGVCDHLGKEEKKAAKVMHKNGRCGKNERIRHGRRNCR